MRAKSPWFSMAAVVLSLAMLSGCARINEGVSVEGAQESPALSNYWANRGYDAMDILRLQWGFPRDFKAFGATGKLTAVLQAGIVFFEGKKVGMERRSIGILRQKKLEGGITPVYYITVREAGEFGNFFMRTDTDWAQARDRRLVRNGFFWSDGTGRPLSVGGEVELFCLGGPDIMFYICELGDFMAGIVGLDPRGDDISRPVHTELDNLFFED